MATKSRTLPLNKRGLNFEMFMWLFTRLSALAIYALILFAVIGALIEKEGLFQVAKLDAPWLMGREELDRYPAPTHTASKASAVPPDER